MKRRILQVNLDGTGGAFSLMYQIQMSLKKSYIFDFYWMGRFVQSDKLDNLRKIGCKFYEGNLRKNKVIGHLLLPFRFYLFLKKHPYDIVHINADLAYKQLLYALPAKVAGVKNIILHSHSSGVNGNHKLLKYFLHKLCRRSLNKVGDTFLSCSSLASKWMFTDTEKVTVINNGVNLKKYKFNLKIRNEVRRELGVNNILLGTVGNLSYQKNPKFLIDLIKSLDSEGRYTLMFVGDGENRREIEAYAKKNNVYEKCIFYGNSSNVASLLDAMDIFIMPSRFEGLPVSAVEAQASGLPCVFSDKITTEAKIISNCYFKSIDRNYKEWDMTIRKISKTPSFNRVLCSNEVKEKGFDIKDSAKKLLFIYSR